MSIFASEFSGIGTGVRVRRAVGVAFKRNGRYSDEWPSGKLLFQPVIFPLSFCYPHPPAVIMDNYRDMVGVCEKRRRAIERLIIKIPLRRSRLPNEVFKLLARFFLDA